MSNEAMASYITDTPSEWQEVNAELVSLQEELSQARKLITELVKIGEFYADKSHWGYSGVPKNRSHLAGIIEDHDCGYCQHNEKFTGGKLARTVLSNNKDLIEKLISNQRDS